MNYIRFAMLISLQLGFLHVEALQHLKKTAALFTGSAIAGVPFGILSREQRDHENYVQACYRKIGNNPTLRTIFDKRVKNEFVPKSENREASPFFSFVTQVLLFLDGVPVKLGRTPVFIKEGSKGSASVRYYQKTFADSTEELYPLDVALEYYAVNISANIYRAAAQAFNPLYCLWHDTVIYDIKTSESSPYRLEVEMVNSLMRDKLKYVLCHEGQHVLDFVYHQKEIGIDMTRRESEFSADRKIQGQGPLQAALLYHNLDKLEEVYRLSTLKDQDGKLLEGQDSEEFRQYVFNNFSRIQEVLSEEDEKPEDCHPHANERIAELEKRTTSGGNRTATVRVIDTRTGTVCKTITLREANNFRIEL